MRIDSTVKYKSDLGQNRLNYSNESLLHILDINFSLFLGI